MIKKIVLYKDEAGEWRYRGVAGNNRTVVSAEQGYRSKWYLRVKCRLLFRGVPIEVKDETSST